MSSSAIVSQQRSALANVTGTIFQITATCENSGPLPDSGIFLYQIGSQADPTTDTFARVATLSDYSQVIASGYGINRWQAIAAGQTYYRASAMAITFTDINTATAGQTSLTDNINDLVNAYEAYSTSFMTAPGGQTIYYPTSDPSILSGLITTWQSNHNATLNAQTLAQTAAATLAQSNLNLTSATNLLAVITNINVNVVSPLAANQTAWSNNTEVLETIISKALNELGTTPVGFPTPSYAQVGTDLFSCLSSLLYGVQGVINNISGQPQTNLSNANQIFIGFQGPNGVAAIQSLLATLSAKIPTSPTLVSTTTVTTAIQAAQTAVQSATNSFNSSAANAAITAQNLLAAQNTENQSLAAIVAVCPDFDPNNPTASLS